MKEKHNFKCITTEEHNSKVRNMVFAAGECSILTNSRIAKINTDESDRQQLLQEGTTSNWQLENLHFKKNKRKCFCNPKSVSATIPANNK